VMGGWFVEKLRMLLDDAGLRRDVGKVGRSLACEEYGWEKRVDELVRVYASL